MKESLGSASKPFLILSAPDFLPALKGEAFRTLTPSWSDHSMPSSSLMLVLKHYFRYFLPGKGSPRLNWGVNFVQLRVDRISDDAEIFANFILLCREYGIIFDFN
jgi:hypothetical protein